MKPYQFAILRYVHDAFAGELVNVGLLMWSPNDHQLLFRVNERYTRLGSFYPGFDGPGFRKMARQVVSHYDALRTQIGHSGQLVLYERPPDSLPDLLPHIVPPDATCFQWSDVRGGIATLCAERFVQLFDELIARHEERSPRERRDNDAIWALVEQRLRDRGLLEKVQTGIAIEAAHYDYRFRSGWQNGTVQVLEPISFDYLEGDTILDTATKWTGRLVALATSNKFKMTGVVAPPQLEELSTPYRKALAILRDCPQVRCLVEEAEVDNVLTEIESDLKSHPDQKPEE